MLRNYLTVAWRTFKRRPVYTLINVGGLAVGLACFLLIARYVQYEFSFDEYHARKDRIYRVAEYSGFDEKNWNAYTTGKLAPEARVSFPQVTEAVRIFGRGPSTLKHQNTAFEEIESIYAEPHLFDVFSFEMLKGNPQTALQRPGTVVLTQSLAERIFGPGADPIGQTLTAPGSDGKSFEVTGVMKDVPPNSHFTFGMVASFETLLSGRLSIGSNQFWNYLLLAEGAQPDTLADRILTYNTATLGKPYVEDVKLEPLTEVHFSSIHAPRQSDKRYVYILSAIAVAILLIACANYMNLATARAAQRAKEVGVRKVVGAGRGQLARQFLGESLLLAGVALPLTLLLLRSALPVFNSLAGTEVALLGAGSVRFLLLVAGVTVGVGLLAGSYPALFLSGFPPVQVLQGRQGQRLSAGRLRQVLIVLQFAATVALIASTFVILRQLNYVQEKNLGFEKEHVLVLPFGSALGDKHEAIKNELLGHPNVVSAAAASAAPGDFGYSHTFKPEGTPADEKVSLKMIFGDFDYLQTLGIELAAGENFSPKRVTDSLHVALVNEAAARALGDSLDGASVVGKRINYFDSERTIIGVMKNFNFESLREAVAPVMLSPKRHPKLPSSYRQMVVRISGEDVPGTLDALEAEWNQFVAERPFDYTFLDERFDQMYRQEQRTAKIFGLFAGLAVLLACLGLYGLAAFAAERRTKEIGIRKAMGASEWSIVRLLSKDFARLVLVAVVLAAPVAWWAMQRWLEGFAYHVELSPWPFAAAGLLALLVAAAVVSTQALRAARTNPAQALRDE